MRVSKLLCPNPRPVDLDNKGRIVAFPMLTDSITNTDAPHDSRNQQQFAMPRRLLSAGMRNFYTNLLSTCNPDISRESTNASTTRTELSSVMYTISRSGYNVACWRLSPSKKKIIRTPKTTGIASTMLESYHAVLAQKPRFDQFGKCLGLFVCPPFNLGCA